VSSVALIWSAKLLATSTLYFLLAPAAGDDYAPRTAAPTAAVHSAARGYRIASTPSEAILRGVVLDGDRPLQGAVVVIEDPPPGRPLDPPHEAALVLGSSNLDPPTIVASTRDRLIARNASAELHTLELLRASRGGEPTPENRQMVANLPLPPGNAPAELPPLDVGTYTWACAVHGDAAGTLVVVDHPYAAAVDAEGRFTMPGVPAGALHLLVVHHRRPPARAVVSVGANGTTDTTLQTKGSR
jgi:hypothetical protein